MLKQNLEQFKHFYRLWILSFTFFIKNIWQFVVIGVCIKLIEFVNFSIIADFANSNLDSLQKLSLSQILLSIILGLITPLISKVFTAYILSSNSNNVFLDFKNIANFVKGKIPCLITAILFKAIVTYILLNIFLFTAVVFAPLTAFIEFIILFDSKKFKDALIINVVIVRKYYLPVLLNILIFNFLPAVLLIGHPIGNIVYIFIQMIFNVNLVMIYSYIKQQK